MSRQISPYSSTASKMNRQLHCTMQQVTSQLDFHFTRCKMKISKHIMEPERWNECPYHCGKNVSILGLSKMGFDDVVLILDKHVIYLGILVVQFLLLKGDPPPKPVNFHNHFKAVQTHQNGWIPVHKSTSELPTIFKNKLP